MILFVLESVLAWELVPYCHQFLVRVELDRF